MATQAAIERSDGVRAEGMVGTRAECIAYIDRVWVDLRPRSLRERMGPGS